MASNRIRNVAALALICATWTGCQLFSGPLDRVQFTAERFEIEGEPSLPAQVELLVVNHSSEDVLVPTCGDRLLVGIEALDRGEWTQLTPGVCQDALFRYLTLGSDESASTLLVLNMSGVFRFELDVRREDDSAAKSLISPVVELTR